ncbi:MAG: MBL fold metallo-hydrolase [Pirellulales bacterium]|nr:MBL fold metallo-hydrolase [Pirellulales bacterium]
MFFWDNGLRLARADLAIDFSRRQPRAFISHAHSDHMARHAYALCTPATAALYHCRLGPRPTLEIPYREPIQWGGLRLTTFPAGHCLGSAMLLAEDGEQSLLYTGDFKLSPSATAEPAELPQADILIIESTYGHPDYRLPPRNQAVEELVDRVGNALSEGALAVIEAYPLGKAQEVTRLLTAAGIPVLQHPAISPISRIYESFGVDLGEYGLWTGRPDPGRAAVVPPRTRPLDRGREVRFAVTGWANSASAKYRLRVDHAIALSDHADYDQLFEAVRRVAPRTIYCTHGPESFADRLREAGYDARPLGRPLQRTLF